MKRINMKRATEPLVSLMFVLIFAVSATVVSAQTTSADRGLTNPAKVDPLNPANWDERDEIKVPDENVHIVGTFPIGMPSFSLVPTVADPAAVYSSISATFSGSAVSPAGQANTPAITRLMADDLTFIGAPPYSIGRFSFSMCNLNVAAVSARPRVRFYLNDNAGFPGTNITGFSFNPITVPANTCTSLFANVAPFIITSSQMWAGMLFDNSTATATATQLNSFGMGIYQFPDAGTSADLYYLTTSAPPAGGSYLLNNPGPGANTSLGGTPLANFGWDFRVAATILGVVRANTDPRTTGGTAQWTVTTTGGSITTLAASNFTLSGASATGSSIASVVANNLSPNSTDWTVTANIGVTIGTLGLNWANVTGLNTNVSNTLPFAGEVYNVNAPVAATVAVSGRVTTANGQGIQNALVVLTSSQGGTRTSRTGSLGYYRFDDVQVGETYVLSVSSKRYQFSPRAISVFDELRNEDFVAEP